MLKSLFKIILTLIIILNQTNEQINLNRDNLANLCKCNPSTSTEINLSNQEIVSIDSLTFNGLTLLQNLDL